MTHPRTDIAAIELITCDGHAVMVPLYRVAQAHSRLRRSSGGEIDRIQKTVAEHFGVSVRALKSPRRAVHLVRARRVAIYLSRELTEYSYPQIGRCFGDRDHSGVLHICRKMDALYQSDPSIKADVDLLRGIVEARLSA